MLDTTRGCEQGVHRLLKSLHAKNTIEIRVGNRASLAIEIVPARIYGRVPMLIACNRAAAHARDIPRYRGYVSMGGVLRQTCLLLSAVSKSCLSGGKCS